MRNEKSRRGHEHPKGLKEAKYKGLEMILIVLIVSTHQISSMNIESIINVRVPLGIPSGGTPKPKISTAPIGQLF